IVQSLANLLPDRLSVAAARSSRSRSERSIGSCFWRRRISMPESKRRKTPPSGTRDSPPSATWGLPFSELRPLEVPDSQYHRHPADAESKQSLKPQQGICQPVGAGGALQHLAIDLD